MIFRYLKHDKYATIGIDLWHAVEFSRYGCALNPRISPNFQGRLPNLVHACRLGQTGPHEVLGLAEAQLLDPRRLLSGLNRPFPARGPTIQMPRGPVKSGNSDENMYCSPPETHNYPPPLGFSSQ